MSNNLKKTLLATAASVAALVGGSSVASADTVSVKAGDTLSGIAADNNTTVDNLAKENNIDNHNFIVAGQTLTVSSPVSTAISADGTKYTVQAGDSLSKIAEQTGVNTATLASINGLSSDNLVVVGQELSLKATTTATATTVTAADQTQTVPEQKLSYIAAADTNKDGFMSIDEYNTYVANGGDTNAVSTQSTVTIPANVKYIAAADTNKDGFMSAEEYNTYVANGGNVNVSETPSQPVAPAETHQVAATQLSAPSQVQQTSASSDVQSLLNSMNAKRAAMGLAPVQLDAGLSARAQARAQDAAANGGIPSNHFSTNGEVVADGFSTEAVIDAWYNETNMMTPNGQPGHRMWVANSRASSVGFGIVNGIIVGESDAGQF
ncbi:LysM peptidoglycan-binding domain-containing protein [Leuconostoc palmae]|uniref:LysM peptidoglycan-binding domain-containing protein n=1 Tax=Leuconostoc palmae TaxID=501487 RepID=UPI001C7CEF16|nr:LysM peptidoglycan-binding domain-containing protein [Leuconostoc palmae]